MKTLATQLLLAICLMIGSSQIAKADIVSMTIDATQSFASISVAGSAPQISGTSGVASLELMSLHVPFGMAQLTDFNIVLDDSLNFSLLGGLVSASTLAGDISIQLQTPGAPGAVNGSNQFDQLANLLTTSGTVEVTDPFNLVGGSQNFDLSTLPPESADFTAVQLTRVGDVITVSANYSFVQTIDGNGTPITVAVTGTMVAFGIAAIPEPNSLFALACLSGTCGFLRRKRNN